MFDGTCLCELIFVFLIGIREQDGEREGIDRQFNKLICPSYKKRANFEDPSVKLEKLRRKKPNSQLLRPRNRHIPLIQLQYAEDNNSNNFPHETAPQIVGKNNFQANTSLEQLINSMHVSPYIFNTTPDEDEHKESRKKNNFHNFPLEIKSCFITKKRKFVSSLMYCVCHRKFSIFKNLKSPPIPKIN